MKYPIRDIQANPFRNIDRYPINRDKVEKLKDSIGRTEFWDNVVARLGPDGKPQIGYGHHRLVALRELFPSNHQVDLIVRPLDDEAMLHVMADENMDEWKSDSGVIVETVRAVRDFLKSQDTAKTGNAAKPNGTEDIAKFLGWPEGRVRQAVTILNAEEDQVVTPEDTKDLALETATRLARAAQQTKDPGTRREVVKRVRRGIKSGTVAVREIGAAARKAKDEIEPPQQPLVLPHQVAAQVAKDIEQFWSNGLSVNGKTVSRRDIVRLMAANRNAEGIRNYTGTLKRVIAEMTKTNDALLDLLTDERQLEVVS